MTFKEYVWSKLREIRCNVNMNDEIIAKVSQSERCFECIASHHKCIAILGSTTKHLNARERPKSKGKEKRNRLHIWWWEFVIRVGYQQCSNQNDLNGYFTGCSIKMTPKRKTWCFDTFHLSHLHLNVIWLVVIYLWLIIRPFYRDKKYIKTAVRYTFAFLCVCGYNWIILNRNCSGQ